MAEAVKVVVRCRPMNSKEKERGCDNIITVFEEEGSLKIAQPGDPESTKQFTFDATFGTESKQKAVYDELGYSLVESVLQGFNGTIFAYGQTGCGKTFTMSGLRDPPEMRGITPNSFDHIFESIKIAQGKEFLVRCSYIELYNEEIRDLLGADPKKKLPLKQHPDKGVYVDGLTEEVTDTVEALEAAMLRGEAHRTVGATAMNATSSRSHSLFQIVIEASEPAETEGGKDHVTRGKLNLVDLAGSERPAKTGAQGARMKEGIKINMSLTALGNVISALVDSKTKHIPYRDSKLTRLLQDSLGGNTKTVMMAAISPADYNYDETLSTLRYADRAKQIKNKPIINEDPKDALLREYKEEIEKLKAALAAATASGDPAAVLAALEAASGGKAGAGGGGAPSTAPGAAAPAPAPAPAEGGAPTAQRLPAAPPSGSSPAEGGEGRAGAASPSEPASVPSDLGATGMAGELEEQRALTEAAQAAQADMAAKLASLQGMLDKKVAGQGGKDDAEVQRAVEEAAARAAEHEATKRRRREAKLKAKQRRLREEAAALQAEMASMSSAAADQEAMLAALVKKHDAELRRREEELRSEAARDRDILVTQLVERDREARLFETLVEAVLSRSDMAQLWERSVWNEDTETWTIPLASIRAAKKGAAASAASGLPIVGGAGEGRGVSPHGGAAAGGGGAVGLAAGQLPDIGRGGTVSRSSSRGSRASAGRG
ncbi:Kif17, partial [Symbiodinium sp. KB8]